MADGTKISWTDATWNPVVGCAKVSAGCDNCYAIRDGARLQHLDAYAGTIADGDWTGVVRCLPERLEQPLRWRKPRRIFVNSMSDLFHPGVSEAFVRQVWDVMEACPQHTFQILTKRPERMARMLNDRLATPEEVDDGCEPGIVPGIAYDRVLPNVWLGTSVEDQTWADRRIPPLVATPAAVRFLSIEPMLGPVSLAALDAIDWVIVGGESGPRARPMHPEWVRRLRDECAEARVAFHLKQWGAWAPYAPEDYSEDAGTIAVNLDGSRGWAAGDEDSLTNQTTNLTAGWAAVEKVGAKAAGRLLDGVSHDAFPA